MVKSELKSTNVYHRACTWGGVKLGIERWGSGVRTLESLGRADTSRRETSYGGGKHVTITYVGIRTKIPWEPSHASDTCDHQSMVV